MSNDFWEFSLKTYDADGVAEQALAVQDQLGLDINTILYASWLSSLELKLTRAHIVGLESCIAQWQQQVVRPLRGVRRELKNFSDVADLRDQMKTIELSCEKHQQDLMWAYFKAATQLVLERDCLHENLGLLVTSEMAKTAPWRLLEGALVRASND